MADIVLVNSSANMRTLGQELRSFGNEITYVTVADIPRSAPKRVFYFFAGYNACFTSESQGVLEKEDRVLMFKHGLVARFRMWNIGKALTALNPELASGNFRDLLMFRRGMLKHEDVRDEVKSFSDMSTLSAEYPESKIITAFTSGGAYKTCRWETDLDLKVTLGSDRFVFFSDRDRVEAFVLDGDLFTLSKAKEHIATITAVMPIFSKFSFKLISEKNVGMNMNPWVSKTGSVYHINDYSFGLTSISMPSAWYDKLAAFMNFDKKK